MEIITSFSETELKQIISDAVTRGIKEFKPPQPLQPDTLTIEEASLFTGLKKATLYKHSHEGTIPVSRRGKKLIFSRKEIEAWLDDQTVRKQSPADEAIDRLKFEAQRRR